MIYLPPLMAIARKKRVGGGHWRFLDDRINALNRITAEPSPAREVYRTVGTILALVRVSTNLGSMVHI